MKTTSKNHPVNQYILDAIDSVNFEDYGFSQPETNQEKLQFVLNTFRKEKSYEIKLDGEFKAFSSWLQGLPTAFNIDFENYRIIEIAKLWNSIPEDATEKQEDKILANWWNFITMRFFTLCRRNKVS